MQRALPWAAWLACAAANAACVDWSSLPRRGEPQDAGALEASAAGDGVAPDELGAPIVHWAFSRYAAGRVPDVASRGLDVSLLVTIEPGQPRPELSGNDLWLRGTEMRSTPESANVVAEAIDAASGGFSVELWYRLGSESAQERQWVVGLAEASSGGFFVLAEPDAFLVNVATSSGAIDVLQPRPADDELHHLVATFRPGAAALVTVYNDGAPVRVAPADRADADTSLDWPSGEGYFVVGDTGLADLFLRSTALFDRELSAEQVARRFAAGPRP